MLQKLTEIKRDNIICLLLLIFILAAQAIASQEATFPRFPAVSPDGKTVAFCYGGDIWTVPSLGGQADRLTASEAYEHTLSWSPDGGWIAFSANRAGNDDIYVIPSGGGQSRQLTYHESDDRVCDWTHNGKAVIFSSRRDDHYADRRILYRVKIDGGTPEPVMDAYGIEAAVSPDGSRILYNGGGSGAPWWRRHYRGSGSSQLWIYDFETGVHTAVTDTAKLETGDDFKRDPSRWPLWGRGEEIYLTAEPDDTPNIYKRDENGLWRKITDYHGDGVRFPSISLDGRVIAYEYGTDIYIVENAGRPQKLTIVAPLDDPQASPELIRYSNKAERLAFTPDDKQMFIEVRGEVFAGRIVGDEDKAARGRANCISGDNPARDGDFTVSPGGDSLIFVSDRTGNKNLYLAYSTDAETPELARSFNITIEQISSDSAEDHAPKWSPDGQHISFIRGKGNLLIHDLESGEERTLLEGWSLPQYNWSPDGRWIAFAREDDEYNSDVFVIPADGGPEINISRHPDEDDSPIWSADGRKLAFRSRRRDNEMGLYFVFLRLEDHYKTIADWAEEARNPETNEDEKDKGKKKKSEEKIEVKIDTTEIYRRIRQVARLADEEAVFAISPNGKKFAYMSDHEGERDLYICEWTGEEVKRLTKGGVNPKYIDFTSDGKRVRYLTNSGNVKSVTVDGKKTASHPFDARVIVDRSAERRQKFGEIWRTLNDRFYHPDFHGYDWAAIRDKYSAPIGAASCERDFGDLVNMMFGELNASHMGYDSPGFGSKLSTGRLGLDFDFSAEGPGLLVDHVQPKGPCARLTEPVIPGERLLAVNGVRLEPDVNLHRLLQDQVGQRIELILTEGRHERRVIVRPMGACIQGELRYDEWVSGRRVLVDSLSGGRLGYLHIRGMGSRSLARFEAQLYSQAHGRDGLVVDVRYNGGGWTTDYLLAMLQVKRHAVTFPRDGGPGYPQGRLPLYSWVEPIIVLCNEFSFSNAEIFSHSTKTLQRGKLVGVPTPGGVISTSGSSLLDGSSFRLPVRGWYFGTEPKRDPERNMEGNGAVPDIIIPLKPGQLAAGDDEQLETAIRELLRELETRERD